MLKSTMKRKIGKQTLRNVCLLSIAFFIFQSNSIAQEKTITGIVTSIDDGTALPGVNVLVKGTSVGTITDINGKYEISAPEEATVLSFSFIGMLSEEFEIGNNSVIDISLAPDIMDLDEITVIGYGVQKKKLLTGATSQVDGENLESRNVTSPLQALQGQTAGINITSTSGQPGEEMKVVIRGLGTIGESKPLFIVDGVTTGNIDYLNSSDIESIDVLKDAASAAIYGSRAANGVVLITTKKGSPGQQEVSLYSYFGVQNRYKKVDMLDSRQYAMIMNEQHLNSGGTTAGLPFDLNNLPAYTENGVASTNWLDEMFVQNALTYNVVLGVNGGTESTTYSTSIGYTGQEGVVGGSGLSNYERFSVRVNSEKSLFNDRVKIGENITVAYIEDNGIQVGDQYGNSLRGAFNTSSLLPVYNDNDEFLNTADETILDQDGNTYWNDKEANPYASMVYNNQELNSEIKLVGNLYAEIELVKNLKFRTSLGLDMYAGEERSFKPVYRLSLYSFNDYSEVTQRLDRGYNWVFDNVLSYSITKDVHKLDVMAGMSAEEYTGVWMYGKNVDLAFNDFQHSYLNNATNTETARMKIEGAPEDNNKLVSYFGRVQYGLNETYLFNATFRADGSSKFDSENRWGYFPSFSAGWILSNEYFMDPLRKTVSFLKLRASWGQNGNQSIKAFQYLAPIKFTQATYPFGDDPESEVNGAYPSRLPNPDIKWETSEQFNIGFDSKILNNKMSVNFDWYRKSTKNWLIAAPVLATAGTDAPFINGGNVINSGVELALSYYGAAGDFNYSVSANGAYNKNNVTDIPTEDGIIHGATNMLYANSGEFYRAESGHPIGYFWGYETDGIFDSPAEVAEHTSSEGIIIQPDAKPGDVKYVDHYDDGIIDDLDKIELGDPNPDFIYGFSFSSNYKAIDFSVFASGVTGNQLVQSYRNHSDQWSNYSTEILDRWNGPGTSETIPRVTKNNINYQFSDLFVKNGSYFRINNVTLGYDFNHLFKQNIMSQCRLYVSVQNLFTFTKYTGMDPEVGFGITDDDDPTDNYSSGIDLGYYPNPRTILVGVSFKF